MSLIRLDDSPHVPQTLRQVMFELGGTRVLAAPLALHPEFEQVWSSKVYPGLVSDSAHTRAA